MKSNLTEEQLQHIRNAVVASEYGGKLEALTEAVENVDSVKGVRAYLRDKADSYYQYMTEELEALTGLTVEELDVYGKAERLERE